MLPNPKNKLAPASFWQPLTSFWQPPRYQSFSRKQGSSALISPEAVTSTFLDVSPPLLPTPSTARTTSIPLTTLPNTTCLPSNHAVLATHRKNWLPLVPGPAFAIESTPGPVCLSWKFSSANFSP